MMKTRAILLTAVFALTFAVGAVAQGPDEISRDPDKFVQILPDFRIHQDALKASGKTAAELGALLERWRKPMPPEPTVDSFEARDALQRMIDDADDNEVVAFYQAVRDLANRRQELKAELRSLTGKLEAIDRQHQERIRK